MQYLVAGGVILAALLLAWAGVEVNHLIHAYPGQFYLCVFATLFIAAAAGVARMRHVLHDVVPLRPEVPPLPKAVPAAPVLLAVAAPDEEEARDCEGPACARKVDSDPWTATAGDDPSEHVFCSHACALAWQGGLSRRA